MTVHTEIGLRIARARYAAGLSQRRLGEALGLQRSAVTDIEAGQRKVSAAELVPLAEALGCGIGQLLGIPAMDVADVRAAGYRDGWRACAEAVNAASAEPTRPAPTNGDT